MNKFSLRYQIKLII